VTKQEVSKFDIKLKCRELRLAPIRIIVRLSFYMLS